MWQGRFVKHEPQVQLENEISHCKKRWWFKRFTLPMQIQNNMYRTQFPTVLFNACHAGVAGIHPVLQSVNASTHLQKHLESQCASSPLSKWTGAKARSSSNIDLGLHGHLSFCGLEFPQDSQAAMASMETSRFLQASYLQACFLQLTSQFGELFHDLQNHHFQPTKFVQLGVSKWQWFTQETGMDMGEHTWLEASCRTWSCKWIELTGPITASITQPNCCCLQRRSDCQWFLLLQCCSEPPTPSTPMSKM